VNMSHSRAKLDFIFVVEKSIENSS